MKPALRECTRALRLAVAAGAALLLFGTGASAASAAAESAAAQMAAEDVTKLLTQRFFEVEFFVFERSAVMDFNTREILTHREPRPYPSRLLALRYPDQPFGSGYQIDPMTQLCLVFPTVSYTAEFTPENALGDNIDIDAADPAVVMGPQGLSDQTMVPQLQPALSQDPGGDPLAAPLQEPPTDPLQDLLAAVAEFELELEEASNRWLPEESFTLQTQARRIKSRAGGRILFHGRWLQSVPPREAPLPVMLPAGAHSGVGKELSGSVAVTLGRYLHFRTALNYTAPALGARPLQVAFSPEGNALPVNDAEGYGPGFMTLAQSRRMRSEELHYLDHPKLGVVVRIDPVLIPDHLLELQTTLDESEQ